MSPSALYPPCFSGSEEVGGRASGVLLAEHVAMKARWPRPSRTYGGRGNITTHSKKVSIRIRDRRENEVQNTIFATEPS